MIGSTSPAACPARPPRRRAGLRARGTAPATRRAAARLATPQAGGAHRCIDPPSAVDPAAQGVEQGPPPAPFGERPGAFDLAELHRQRDRELEHLLHVAEQAGLELLAAKTRTHAFGERRSLERTPLCFAAIATCEPGACQAIECPQAVVVRIRAGGPAGGRFERGRGFIDTPLREQQAALDARAQWGQRRLCRGLPLVHRTGLAAATGAQVGIDQRQIDQRAEALGRHLGGLAVQADRLVVAPASRRDIAQRLVCRPGDDGGILRHMLERFTCVPFGTVEIARVAVRDRKVAFGKRDEILVSLGLPHMQGTRG